MFFLKLPIASRAFFHTMNLCVNITTDRFILRHRFRFYRLLSFLVFRNKQNDGSGVGIFFVLLKVSFLGPCLIFSFDDNDGLFRIRRSYFSERIREPFGSWGSCGVHVFLFLWEIKNTLLSVRNVKVNNT